MSVTKIAPAVPSVSQMFGESTLIDPPIAREVARNPKFKVGAVPDTEFKWNEIDVSETAKPKPTVKKTASARRKRSSEVTGKVEPKTT